MNMLDRFRMMLTKHPEVREAPAPNPRDFDGDELPGPGQPITLAGAREENPRLFDYEYNLNANFQPRTEFNYLPTFFHLHAFYQISPEVRVAANFFIEKILSVPYEVIPRKGTKFDPQRLETLRRMVEMPDPTVQWRHEQWMRAMLQEMVITDAVTIFPLHSVGGDFIAWQLIDGQTIKPIIADKGGRPMPPNPSFVQYIHGRPYASMMADELIYYPFRPRVWCSYGESRVEEVIGTIATLSAFNTYTNLWFGGGNIPESVALIDREAVKGINEKQLAKYQVALDEIVGMNSGRRRLFQMPPHIRDVKPVKQFEFNKELPEWLVRILCVQFGVPAMLFVSDTNRATAKEITSTLTDMQFRRTLMSVKRFWDELLRCAGGEDFEFVYRQPRDFSVDATEGLLKLCTTPTPEGPALMTLEEGRMELGLLKETDNEPEGDDNDPATAAPTEAAGAEALAELQRAVAGLSPAAPTDAPAVVKAAPAAAPVNRVALAHKSVTAKSRMAVQLMKAVKPLLDAERKRLLAEGVRQAKARGRRVVE